MSVRRVFALYAAVILAFFCVICRLYWLASNEGYALRVQSQSTVTLALPARRGNFYDCDGLPLTGLEPRYYALCLPGEGSYSRLYSYTNNAGQALLYQNRNHSAPFLLELTQNIPFSEVATYTASTRYSTAPLCRHLIGYVDGEGHGVAGLEAALDGQLFGTGAHDSVRCNVTAQGRLQNGSEAELVHADSGAVGVRLTISRSVQRAVEAVASETMTTGCILVLDAANAKVRASVSMPDFDPENVAASLTASDSPLVNRALCAYAVGSVFKPVLAAAALEQGLTDLVVECPGYTTVDGRVFRCASGTAHGETDLAAALQKSCNGYFIHLGQALGAQNVYETARSLGFGQASTLAGSLRAAEGEMPDLQTLSSSGEFANFCFGQGQLLATPVQVAGMMNAIAAGGVWREPLFLECTLDEATGEELESLSSPAHRRVFSEETAATLRKLLTRVVTDGTGREAAPPQGTAGGKTGTAQTGQFDPISGEERKNLWFAGFWPAENPRYTVVVLQDAQLDPAFSSAAIFAKVCEALALLEIG